MLEWLQSIGGFLQNVAGFFVSFFKNVIEIVSLVLKGLLYMSIAITYLPIQYQAVLVALVAFCVIVTIIHFGG